MRRKRLPMGGLVEVVMTVLWEDGGWLTAREVHARVQSERRLAHTTVTTVLVRLWEKDRLDRRKEGRSYAYRPKANRAEWTAAQMATLLSSVGDRRAALAHFSQGLNEKDRRQLRQILEERAKR